MTTENAFTFLLLVKVPLGAQHSLISDVLSSHFLYPVVFGTVVILHAELSQHHVRIRTVVELGIQRAWRKQEQYGALLQTRCNCCRFGRPRWSDPHRDHLQLLVDPSNHILRCPRFFANVLNGLIPKVQPNGRYRLYTKQRGRLSRNDTERYFLEWVLLEPLQSGLIVALIEFGFTRHIHVSNDHSILSSHSLH
uniref:Putative secreted protein n=1 Tax=Anopheles darlingi TaxID=43151 RepID=A0A2M4DCN4_ANODA